MQKLFLVLFLTIFTFNLNAQKAQDNLEDSMQDFERQMKEFRDEFKDALSGAKIFVDTLDFDVLEDGWVQIEGDSIKGTLPYNRMLENLKLFPEPFQKMLPGPFKDDENLSKMQEQMNEMFPILMDQMMTFLKNGGLDELGEQFKELQIPESEKDATTPKKRKPKPKPTPKKKTKKGKTYNL